MERSFGNFADTASSERQLREAVMLLPGLSKAWYDLGFIAAARQDSSQARTYFKKALLFTPDNRPLRDYVNGEAALPAPVSSTERVLCPVQVASLLFEIPHMI